MSAAAMLFRDRFLGDDWCVEWVNDAGVVEVATFSGPGAHQRAVCYADRQYGLFEELDPEPHKRRGS